VSRGSDVSGEVVLITGASRGLGRALAEAFGRGGARLALCARGESELRAVAEGLEAAGVEVAWSTADVRDDAALRALSDAARERFGGVSVLVTNASVLGPRIPLRDHDLGEWRRVVDINLTGTLAPILAVLPGMRAAGRGSIITVSSGAANAARAGWGAYAVSKWGVEALSRNLALEEAEAGVRVNIVDPGRLRTDMRREAYPDEDPAAPAPPAAAVGVFLWLASPASVGVTGERFDALDWP
jgi:NAD(P)-dependent dehydrogenase (short-subunit alcohol dehydrogenase family)